MWQSPTALLCPLRGIEARSPAGRRQKSAAQCPHQGINRQPGSGGMCADGGLTMPAACAHRPSGRRLAAQGKLYLLTEQENVQFA